MVHKAAGSTLPKLSLISYVYTAVLSWSWAQKTHFNESNSLTWLIRERLTLRTCGEPPSVCSMMRDPCQSTAQCQTSEDFGPVMTAVLHPFI
ncbi:hypothetical protein BDY19DRAFT_125843 [Irpex rosettiformis]|uniref:Uncharacterized protein n=1 Tax=Irpex rosettiformis TaxID=378272 RepID=A0ACB8U4F8_9APHY|nr:hypothetical protein BDY19DRAFT_125843 [Irpex rosettiformis]